MITYANDVVEIDGCYGCSFAKGEFTLPCGMAYENERFTLAQDFELPIEGFLVLAPKKCVEKLSDLSDEERNEMFLIVNKTIKILRNNNICEMFNVIFEEKKGRHLHVWIMPRHDWMKEVGQGITGNIDKILEYAKSNFKTPEVFKRINEISEIIRNNFDN